MISKDTFSCWIIAIALSFINLSNGWIWISYAPIGDFTSQFYLASLNEINWISLSFIVVIIVLGFPLIWFIDRYGIKKTLVIASVLNFLTAAIRAISSASFIPESKRYIILLSGSIFSAISQPLGLFSSTKLATLWFSATKRGFANNVASMGNPLGIILGNILSPIIVTHKDDLSNLNNLYLIPHSIILLFVLFSVCISPANSNQPFQLENISFLKQIKLCFKNCNFVILNVAFAINIGIFTTFSTLIQQILCPFGYSDLFSGLCGSLLPAMGFPGSLVCLYLVNKTGSLVIIIKSFIMSTAIGMIFFSMGSVFTDQEILIALTISWMGFFGFGCYACAFELAVETAYPAGEVVTTGLLMLLSQAFSIILISLGQEIAIPAPELSKFSKCSVKDIRNYWITNSSIATIGVINASVLMLFFNTKYNRLTMEKEIGSHDLSPQTQALFNDCDNFNYLLR